MKTIAWVSSATIFGLFAGGDAFAMTMTINDVTNGSTDADGGTPLDAHGLVVALDSQNVPSKCHAQSLAVSNRHRVRQSVV
jgi:hypothetical protein